MEGGLEPMVEALLFIAGKPLTVGDLCERLNAGTGDVEAALQSLQKHHRRRKIGSLRVNKAGKGWVLEVATGLSEQLESVARAEIPKRLLPTAALIAYHQPISQSDLVQMIGQKAYDHVHDLSSFGLIDRRRDGNTRRLTTTARFAEYFGCPSADRNAVRAWFRERASALGLDASDPAMEGDRSVIV